MIKDLVIIPDSTINKPHYPSLSIINPIFIYHQIIHFSRVSVINHPAMGYLATLDWFPPYTMPEAPHGSPNATRAMRAKRTRRMMRVMRSARIESAASPSMDTGAMGYHG